MGGNKDKPGIFQGQGSVFGQEKSVSLGEGKVREFYLLEHVGTLSHLHIRASIQSEGLNWILMDFACYKFIMEETAFLTAMLCCWSYLG